MQFNIKTQVFGATKATVDGNTYVSVFTGQPTTTPDVVHGLEVTKMSADPSVFDQLKDLVPGQEVEFIAIIKRAAGGKSQPYFIGTVPSSSPRSLTNNQEKAKA